MEETEAKVLPFRRRDYQDALAAQLAAGGPDPANENAETASEVLTPDDVLGRAVGAFADVIVIGRSKTGHYEVRSTESVAMANLMLDIGKGIILNLAAQFHA